MNRASLNYAEQQALAVLKKAMRNKPEIITLLFKDQSKELAYMVLKQLSAEMKDLIAVNRAFQLASKALIEAEKPNETDQIPT